MPNHLQFQLDLALPAIQCSPVVLVDHLHQLVHVLLAFQLPP